MKDVAAAAGCSTMTVSLALRNSPKVSAATRRRVLKLARKLGYEPSPFVSALMAWRRKPRQTESDVLAVLTKFDIPLLRWVHDNPFHSELWGGLEERAAELGFRLEEFPVYGKQAPDGRKLTRILTTRGIRGVFLFPGGGLDRGYPELDWRHFAVIAAGFHARHMFVHRVASDYSHAMEIALSEIERLGYRRPGLAMTSYLDPLIRYVMSAYFLSWQQTRPPRQRVPLVPGKTAGLDPEVFAAWLRRHQPDVVLSLEPGVHQLMGKEQQRRTGFVHLAKRKNEPFAGVNLHTRNVGRTAIDIWARELYLNRFGLPEVPEVILVAGSWEAGPTVRSLRR